jgi:methylenetetrahydrofolate reductase (NADPH)
VDGYGDCIWLRAYERLKHDGKEQDLLEHAPVVQNQGLRGTSAWANNWLGRDHAAKKANVVADQAVLEKTKAAESKIQ